MQSNSNQLIDEIRKQLGEDALEKLAACKTDEGRLRLLRDSGIELSDEMLEGIAGGGLFSALRGLAQEAWEEIEGLF